MAKSKQAKRVYANGFYLRNDQGEIVASLETTGLGTPIFHMHNKNGPGLQVGLTPDQQCFVHLLHADGTVAFTLRTDALGAAAAACTNGQTNAIFRSNNDGSLSFEFKCEVNVTRPS